MSFFLFPLMIIFVIFIFVIVLGFSLFRSILSIFFPSLRRRSTTLGGFNQNYNQRESENNNSYNTEKAEKDNSFRTQERKKIFSADEGEYVEFEEIKE